jgi:Transcriptional regulator
MRSQVTEENSNNVKSVLKAFLIMEELDKGGELSIGDLSERLSMDKATVHRLINTIKEAGYANQNLDNKKYSNSLKLLAMGNRVMEKTGVKHISRVYMETLSAQSGETINLGVCVGNKIIYIDKLESTSTIKVGLGIGTSVPIYCSGLGKAILAFIPEKDVKSMLDTIAFEKFTNHTIVDREELIDSLREIRKAGYSVDDEEYVEGLICIGAPIFDYHGLPVAAITISCPKYRYNVEKHLTLFSGLVIDAAQKISKQLGYKKRVK